MELAGCGTGSRPPHPVDERVMEIDELAEHIVIFTLPSASHNTQDLLGFLAD
jgi:hypothetical protein